MITEVLENRSGAPHPINEQGAAIGILIQWIIKSIRGKDFDMDDVRAIVKFIKGLGKKSDKESKLDEANIKAMGDIIFDDQTKLTKPNGIDKATYYDVFQAEPKNEYRTRVRENKMDIKQIIKEELSTVLENYDETLYFPKSPDSLGELERIADEFEEIAALSPSAMIQRRLRELIERLRQAVAAHREEMSQPG